MIQFNVNFRGLFAVVRHTTPPVPGQPPSAAEPMTLLFPKDTGGVSGFLARGHGGGHGAASAGGHEHHPVLYVPEDLVGGREGELPPLRRSEQQTEDGYVAFSLEGWILRLPMSDRQDDVQHEPDEDFGLQEPSDNQACALVGPNADWRPLSRLPTLNALTTTGLGVNLAAPDSSVVDTVVRLSGGRLDCVRSFKALRDAFFEFFTDTRTVAIQPAAEDVVFTSATADGNLTIGLSPIQLPSVTVEKTLTLTQAATLVVTSLPPKGAPKPINLNHFFNFYPLMKPGGRAPFLRVLARCDGGTLVHTMPGINAMNLREYKQPHIRTDEHCSCLTAQVITDQPAAGRGPHEDGRRR